MSCIYFYCLWHIGLGVLTSGAFVFVVLHKYCWKRPFWLSVPYRHQEWKWIEQRWQRCVESFPMEMVLSQRQPMMDGGSHVLQDATHSLLFYEPLTHWIEDLYLAEGLNTSQAAVVPQCHHINTVTSTDLSCNMDMAIQSSSHPQPPMSHGHHLHVCSIHLWWQFDRRLEHQSSCHDTPTPTSMQLQKTISLAIWIWLFIKLAAILSHPWA